MRSSRPILAVVVLLTFSAGLTAIVAAAEPPVPPNDRLAIERTVHDTIDLIHVLRINGDWRIVNVLWKPLRSPVPAK